MNNETLMLWIEDGGLRCGRLCYKKKLEGEALSIEFEFSVSNFKLREKIWGALLEAKPQMFYFVDEYLSVIGGMYVVGCLDVRDERKDWTDVQSKVIVCAILHRYKGETPK